VLFPLVVRAFGVLASMAGIWVVRTEEDADPMQALNKGYYLTTLLAAVGFGIGCPVAAALAASTIRLAQLLALWSDWSGDLPWRLSISRSTTRSTGIRPVRSIR
jgi:Na+/H+-translocating membrane pyrophosphatase